MLSVLRQLFGFLQQAFRMFADRQLLDAGKAEQANAAIIEGQDRVAKAEQAVSVADPVRDERLRSRFDRSSSGGE
jgi:hypothetical protein